MRILKKVDIILFAGVLFLFVSTSTGTPFKRDSEAPVETPEEPKLNATEGESPSPPPLAEEDKPTTLSPPEVAVEGNATTVGMNETAVESPTTTTTILPSSTKKPEPLVITTEVPSSTTTVESPTSTTPKAPPPTPTTPGNSGLEKAMAVLSALKKIQS